MKNIITCLTELGIEVPEDKQEALNKAVLENYKTIAEFDKLRERADKEKARADGANETLKKFEGLDPENVSKEIEQWKQKALEAEKEYNAKAEERDYADALEKELGHYKFSSKLARAAILEQLKKEKLPVREGKILGLSDRMEQIKAEDAMAFAPDKSSVPNFTAPKSAPAKVRTKAEIAAIEDDDEREQAWKDYLSRGEE